LSLILVLVPILVCIFGVLFGGERQGIENQEVRIGETDCLDELNRLLGRT